MFNKILKINLVIIFFISISFAEIITGVKIEGNKRISKQSIMVFGNVNIGDSYSPDDLNAILKNIYDTKFFKKINLDIKDSILSIIVDENPIIEAVEINGIKQTKLIDFILENISLQNRKSYIESSFKSDLNLIKNIIKSSGYYFAKIDSKYLLNESQNSVKLIYDIDLGEKAKINEIQFLGDKKIKDRKLKNVITSEEAKFWKFISQSKYLNYERIELDKRLLTNYYRDNGYYQVSVNNSFVEFKNNGTFKLIYTIDAGEKFLFNKLSLDLSDEYDKKYFIKINKALKKLENKEYSLTKIEKVLREVDKIALSKQYEFIDASLEESIEDNNKLNVIITLVDTEKFYVEKINILGNEFTLEEVIRNSFIVDEGDAYNEILFNRSINNIKSKRIFASVETEVLAGSSDNQKIINLSVVEKPTGEISLGAGFGSSGGTIGAGIKESNFLGKGIKLNTDLSIATNTIKGTFIYEKPNFNYSDNSLLLSATSTARNEITIAGYKSSEIGFSVGTSFEQYENFYITPRLSTTHETLTTTSSASANYKKQEGSYFDNYLNYTLDYDTRNKRYKPDEGFRNTFNQNLPLYSKNNEILNSFETIKYQKFSNVVTRYSFYGSAVNSLNGNDVRVSKRLHIPGSKLRGFETGKVGPKEKNDYVGGNYISTLNFSATLPKLLPSFQNTDVSFFLDAANLWGIDYDSTLDDRSTIRSATGLAVDIFTPIGPLNFSYSFPITKNSSDKTESVRFNLGTTF